MTSTKLAFLAVAAVLLLQASWCAVAQQAHTPAVMTVTSFEGDGSGGGPAACDGIYHSNGDPLAALSTVWYAGGSRCQKAILITSTQTGRFVVAEVVDECDSDSGCKDNMISTSQAVWNALGLNTFIGEVPVTWSVV